ncbi:MAG: ABC transporter substrate-binding protein [Gemmataceae bacterium]|nr:ABC transporter substrate-binding protein [Gemmataceae bacterium]
MRMSRRHFTVLMLGTAALAGCQQAGPAPAPKSEAKPVEGKPAAPAAAAPATTAPAAKTAEQKPTTGAPTAAKPQQRDNLTVAIAGEPNSLDTTNELGNVGVRMHYVFHDTLLRRDFLDGNKLVPSLATSWKRLDDVTLELKLRDGVLFHDGSKLTADDVKFTFDRIMDPQARSEATGYFAVLAKVEATDPQTVRLTTKSPDPLLEQRLASYGSWILPKAAVEKMTWEKFIQAPVGAGPYKVVEWKRESQLVAEAHDRYWDAAPAAKRLTFRLIPETSTRVSALLAGEVDIITNLPPDQVDTVESSGSAYVKAVPLANAHVLRYNTIGFPPIADVRVRQAMNLAIDREGLVKSLWRGRATVPNGFQFAGEFGSNPDRPKLEYNPDKAKAMVQAGGYNGDPLVFRTSPVYYSNGRQAAEAIVEMWKKVGLNAQIEVAEQAALGKIDEAGQQHITNWSATSALGDPDGYLWRNWGPDNNFQKRGYWKPEEFNKLGQEARSILDQKRRYEIYQRMMDIFEADAPGTVLYIPLESYGLKKGVDWTPYPIYYFDPRAYNLKLS